MISKWIKKRAYKRIKVWLMSSCNYSDFNRPNIFRPIKNKKNSTKKSSFHYCIVCMLLKLFKAIYKYFYVWKKCMTRLSARSHPKQCTTITNAMNIDDSGMLDMRESKTQMKQQHFFVNYCLIFDTVDERKHFICWIPIGEKNETRE